MGVDKDNRAKAGEHAAGTRPGPSVQPGATNSSGVSGSDSSPPHGRGRSRTRRPKKRAKLAATVTTDDENDSTEPMAKRSRPTVRDIDTPVTAGYASVSDDERCRRCKKRNLHCAINPGRACWQCACTKYACSAMVTVPAQFRTRSQDKSTPARRVTSSPAPAPRTRSPSRVAHQQGEDPKVVIGRHQWTAVDSNVCPSLISSALLRHFNRTRVCAHIYSIVDWQEVTDT